MKITIFGLAGSGTSTIGKALAEKTGYEFKSSGNIMREWAEQEGMTIYEFEDSVVKTDDSFDLKLDNKVAFYGDTSDKFIFESRLAWHFIPDSVKIFLDCNESERYKRIHKREGGDLEEIFLKNQKREAQLIERYKQVYPDITFPPKQEDFDIYIDSTSMKIDDVITAILEQLKK